MCYAGHKQLRSRQVFVHNRMIVYLLAKSYSLGTNVLVMPNHNDGTCYESALANEIDLKQ